MSDTLSATAARNKANYLSAKQAFNDRDLDRCMRYYASDHQICSKPSPRGRQEIRAFLENSHRTWAGMRLVVEHVLAQDDWVMGRSVVTATHSTPVFGVTPTGKVVETTFWDLHRFDGDGLIVETWNLMDGLTLMGALGLVPPAPTPSLANTLRTVQSYEGFARQYDTLVDEQPSPDLEDTLRRFVRCLPPGGSVLEIGSGPGRDADFVESLGATVRRTDATRAFIDLMAERGRHADLLNVITDPLGGPYDGVLAMCVLIHVDRGHLDAVLRKVRDALKPAGAFLVSMRRGDGETGGDYHTVYWERDTFGARLAAAGLAVEWDAHSVDSDGDGWVTFLARRPA